MKEITRKVNNYERKVNNMASRLENFLMVFKNKKLKKKLSPLCSLVPTERVPMADLTNRLLWPFWYNLALFVWHFITFVIYYVWWNIGHTLLLIFDEQLLRSETMVEKWSIFRRVRGKATEKFTRTWVAVTVGRSSDGAGFGTIWEISRIACEVAMIWKKIGTEQISITVNTKVKQSLTEWKWVSLCSHAKKLQPHSFALSSVSPLCNPTIETRTAETQSTMPSKTLTKSIPAQSFRNWCNSTRDSYIRW